MNSLTSMIGRNMDSNLYYLLPPCAPCLRALESLPQDFLRRRPSSSCVAHLSSQRDPVPGYDVN